MRCLKRLGWCQLQWLLCFARATHGGQSVPTGNTSHLVKGQLLLCDLALQRFKQRSLFNVLLAKRFKVRQQLSLIGQLLAKCVHARLHNLLIMTSQRLCICRVSQQ